MSTEEPVIEEFVVLPDVILTTGKKGTVLARAADEKKEMLFFTKDKVTRGLMVGHVYQIPVRNEGKTFVFSSRKWLRQYDDDSMVRAWQAKQRAFDLLESEKAMEKKFSNSSQLEMDIEPLRLAYQGLSYPQRLAFEMYVLSVMRRRT